MSRYQKYQADQYLPSFGKHRRHPSALREHESNYSSHSQEHPKHTTRIQDFKQGTFSKFRQYTPRPVYRKSHEFQAYDSNRSYDFKNTDPYFRSPRSTNYDLSTSAVSAFSPKNTPRRQGHFDISNIENIPQFYQQESPLHDKRRLYHQDSKKESNRLLKQKYKSFLNELKTDRGRQENERLNRTYNAGDFSFGNIELIPHKQVEYDYGGKTGSSSKKQSEYRTDGFKKNKSKYEDKYLTGYGSQIRNDHLASEKVDYTRKGQLSHLIKPRHKSQIQNKSFQGNYDDLESRIKNKNIKDIKIEVEDKTGEPYGSNADSYNKLTLKAAVSPLASEHQRIRQAKKRFLDEMKAQLQQVSTLIEKSKQNHLQTQKTLESFSCLPKSKPVYQKIKFIADIRDFQLGKQKGEGKFGTVHQAIHKATRTLYAIKKIPKETIKTYMLENQLALEIQIQSFLDHQNILKIYGFFDDWQYVYIVLEYMEEGTLFEYLKKRENNRLTEKDVSSKIREITQAVKYLHSINIAHRDIKPQNIVLSNGIAKLCDFGWATRCKYKRRQTYCGTFDYTAPELHEGKEYNESVDLWCLGILTYQLLFGKSPFYHLSKQQTKKRVLRVDLQEIEFPKEVDISWKAKDFIESLLKKDPNERMKVQSLLSHPFLADPM